MDEDRGKPGEITEVDTRLLATDLFTLLAPPATMRMEASTSLPLIRAHQAPLEQVDGEAADCQAEAS